MHPSKRLSRLAVSCLGLANELRELRISTKWFQPRIVHHGRKAREAPGHNTPKQLERSVFLAKVRQVPCEVEQPFGIPKIRLDDSPDRCHTFCVVPFEQGTSGNHEVAHARARLPLQMAQRHDRFRLTTERGKRDRDNVGVFIRLGSGDAGIVRL